MMKFQMRFKKVRDFDNPCYVLPLVEDGEDGMQIWRVAADILNKQSRTVDKALSSSLGVGRGDDTSP
jgi:hypothetical protein